MCLKGFLGICCYTEYCSSAVVRVVYWIDTVISWFCTNIMLTSHNIVKNYVRMMVYSMHFIRPAFVHMKPHIDWSALRRPSTRMTWMCFRDFLRISKIKKTSRNPRIPYFEFIQLTLVNRHVFQELEQQMDLRGVPRHRFLPLGWQRKHRLRGLSRSRISTAIFPGRMCKEDQWYHYQTEVGNSGKRWHIWKVAVCFTQLKTFDAILGHVEQGFVQHVTSSDHHAPNIARFALLACLVRDLWSWIWVQIWNAFDRWQLYLALWPPLHMVGKLCLGT